MSNSSSKSPKLVSISPLLTLEAAKIISAACAAKAAEIRIPMNIAIVDSTLHLLHFERMPNAKLTSVDIAINKAFTAAGHKAPTSVYKDNVWPGGKAFGLNNSNNGKFMYVAGGIPIVANNTVVGAVGCSTGTPDQDVQVAQAGVDAFNKEWERQGGAQQLKGKL